MDGYIGFAKHCMAEVSALRELGWWLPLPCRKVFAAREGCFEDPKPLLE